MHGIHITGASGSGTTTLGRALARHLGLRHLDSDDILWLPTDPPYTTTRPRDERIALLDDLSGDRGFVLSGSCGTWADLVCERFALVVWLQVPTEVRLARLRAREAQRYGDDILPGGRMHEAHLAFLAWAALYDTADASVRGVVFHRAWFAQHGFRVLPLDGTRPTDALVDHVADAWTRLDEIARFVHPPGDQ